MIWVLHVEVSGGYVIMVNSVLNVFKVFVSLRHADLTQLINHFVLYILSTVLDVLILRV